MMTADQIAKRLGCSNSLVYFHVRKLGLVKKEVVKPIKMETDEKYTAVKLLQLLARAKIHADRTNEKANIKMNELRQAYSQFELYEL